MNRWRQQSLQSSNTFRHAIFQEKVVHLNRDWYKKEKQISWQVNQWSQIRQHIKKDWDKVIVDHLNSYAKLSISVLINNVSLSLFLSMSLLWSTHGTNSNIKPSDETLLQHHKYVFPNFYLLKFNNWTGQCQISGYLRQIYFVIKNIDQTVKNRHEPQCLLA